MDDIKLAERLISTENLFDGHVVHLRRLTVELPNGKPATRELVRHVGAAAVVAVDKQGGVALVRQWRCAADRVMLEIPAGKLDNKGEDRLAAAQRELREETGMRAQNWVWLGDILTTPGFSDEMISLYLATELLQGEMQPDDDEFLGFEMVNLHDLYARIYRGEIHDGKTVCALLLARPRLEAMGLL